jgi:hypothetical protein
VAATVVVASVGAAEVVGEPAADVSVGAAGDVAEVVAPLDTPALLGSLESLLEQLAAAMANRPITQNEIERGDFISDLLSPSLPGQR